MGATRVSAGLILLVLVSGCGRSHSTNGGNITQAVNAPPKPSLLPYNFQTGAIGVALAATSNASIKVTPCPPGLSGTDVGHYILVGATADTAEAVLVTGGTCVDNADSGTISFNVQNAHAASEFLFSASSGIQEEGNFLLETNGGTVNVPSGVRKVYAPIRFDGKNVEKRLMLSLQPNTTIEFPNGMAGDGITFAGVIGGAHMLYSGIQGGRVWAGSDTNLITGSLIVFDEVDYATADSVEMRGGAVAGVRLERCYGATVANGYFVHNHYGVYSTNSIATDSSNQILIRDNQFYDNLNATGAAVYSDTFGSAWVIDGNYFEGLVGNGVLNTTVNNTWRITNNFFNSNTGSVDVGLMGNSSIVSLNSFINKATSLTGNGVIAINSSGAGNTITSNSFTAYTGTGRIATINAADQTVADNTCVNITAGVAGFVVTPGLANITLANNSGCP
jgi:hypothetical protein